VPDLSVTRQTIAQAQFGVGELLADAGGEVLFGEYPAEGGGREEAVAAVVTETGGPVHPTADGGQVFVLVVVVGAGEVGREAILGTVGTTTQDFCGRYQVAQPGSGE